MIRRLAAVLPLAMLLLPTLHATATPPTSWIGVSGREVVYLDWTDRGGALSGTVQVTSATGEPAAMSTWSRQAELSGSEAGGKVTLRFGGAILGTTRSGTIGAATLTLESAASAGVETTTFTPGRGGDYNRAVRHLHARLATANAHASRRLRAAAVQRIFAALPRAMRTVERDRTAVRAPLAALATAWAAQQAASRVRAGSCFTTDQYGAASDAYDALVPALGRATRAADTFALDVETLGMTPSGLNGSTRSSFTGAQRALLARATALDERAASQSEAVSAAVTDTTTRSKALIDAVAGMPSCAPTPASTDASAADPAPGDDP